MSDSVEALFERYGPAYRWLMIAAGMTGVSAMVLSATIANVAVPSVMGAFGVGQDQAQWLATAFLATMTAGQLLNAWLVAALGQRMGYMALIAVFTIGTAIAASAPNMDTLALGRVIQGLAAGARGVDEDTQVPAQLFLADELVEDGGPQAGLGRVARLLFGCHDPVLAHGPCSFGASSAKPDRISASTSAAAPKRRVA